MFLRKANYDNIENCWPLSLRFHYTMTDHFNGWISNDYFIKYQKELPIKIKAESTLWKREVMAKKNERKLEANSPKEDLRRKAPHLGV